MYESSVFFTSSPAFVICIPFDDGHFDKCEVNFFLIIKSHVVSTLGLVKQLHKAIKYPS